MNSFIMESIVSGTMLITSIYQTRKVFSTFADRFVDWMFTFIVSRFSTTALHQTNVKLTWDETDPGRQRATMRKFKKEDLLEMDFNAYLASSSDEEDKKDGDEKMNEDQESSDNEDKKIDKYKVRC